MGSNPAIVVDVGILSVMLGTVGAFGMSRYDSEQKQCAAVSVTIGVTWGQQGFASGSDQ
jgi:hypothetical protein